MNDVRHTRRDLVPHALGRFVACLVGTLGCTENHLPPPGGADSLFGYIGSNECVL